MTPEMAAEMTPERWQRIKEIFEQAVELEPGARTAFLDAACAADGGLRREVETLLAADAADGSFIEAPAIEAVTELFPAAPPEAVEGRRVGPYKLLREIGRGGMGAVYLAARADGQYQQRVALKLIARDFGPEEVVRRFRAERQILAALNHPHIARLLDGGASSDSRPYFVMEYIEGESLTAYCDRRRLSTAERLKLFRDVCAAVHYAHQNLVVHRDLKPSNILVTSDGAVKLLDFGIAKLLNPELSGLTIDPTATALRMMTPEYASPEQVRGEKITTASDIYSLGVVLYELLAGERPYRLTSRQPHEILRIVCEQEPERPSTVASRQLSRRAAARAQPPGAESPESLRRTLRGDLDNIVLMALRKEPERRYLSANQLVADIRRYLDGLPVTARPNTLPYRAEKFVRRHKTGVAAAAFALLALLTGTAAAVWQARTAVAERERAERRFSEGRKLANLFLFKIYDEVEKLTGATNARELMVQGALEYLDGLAGEAGDDAELQHERAAAYLRVGDVQGNPNSANLGHTAEALKSYENGRAIAESLVARDSANARYRRLLALSHGKVGDVLAHLGKVEEALASRRRALALFEPLAEAAPADAQAQVDLSRCYLKMGDDLGNPNFPNLGDTGGAMGYFRRAMNVAERMAARDPQHAPSRRYVYLAHERIADLLALTGDPTGAIEHYRQSQAITESLLAADQANWHLRRHLAVLRGKIATLLAERGEMAEALEQSRLSHATFEALYNSDPANADARHILASSHGQRGQIFAAARRTAEALAHCREQLTLLEGLFAADRANTVWHFELAGALHALAALYAPAGQTAEARRLTVRALGLQKGLAERTHATATDLHLYARALLTAEPAELRDPAAALPHARRAVEMTRGTIPALLDTLALAYHLTGDHARAVTTAEQGLALLKPDAPARRDFAARLAKFKAAAKGQP